MATGTIQYANATGYLLDGERTSRKRFFVDVLEDNNRDLSGTTTVKEYMEQLRRSRTWLLGAGTKDRLLFIKCVDFKSVAKEGDPVFSRPDNEFKERK